MGGKRGVWIGLAAVIIAGLVAWWLLDDDDDDGGPPPKSPVTVHVDGADRDDARDDTITAPRALVRAIARNEAGDHAGLMDETPPGVPESELIEAREQQERIRRSLDPLPTAGATARVPGCRTRFVRNQGARNGVRPRQHWYHYTVSPNRRGWADVNAIVAYFNRPSSGVSSHFVIDAEGHCAYIVPIARKAWTQAAANSIAVSYEIINTGRERRYLGPAGYRKLARVTRIAGRRAGIPTRRGRVRGCRVLRTGIVDHRQGGVCAGSHVDIAPFSIARVVRRVARIIRRAGKPRRKRRRSRLTRVERRVVAKRCYHRRQHLAGRKRRANLRWARHYKRKTRALMRKIDRAKRRDGRSWRYRNRGVRRKALAGKLTGRTC